MRITIFDSINELKRFFGFRQDGIIIENDIDHIESECDFFERKRRDAEVLCTLSANCTGPCLDIGTSHGRSAAEIASNNPASSTYTVNLLPEQVETDENFITHLLTKEEIGSYYRGLNITNIEQIYANTSTWVIPGKISEIVLAFIDGNHDTKAVYSDSNLIYDRVREDGFILWHDFSPTMRKKYEWIDAAMTGVEQFLDSKSLDIEVFHLRNSWIGFIRKNTSISSSLIQPSKSSQSSNCFLTDKEYWSGKHSPPFTPWTVNGMLFSSILEHHMPVNNTFVCAEIGAYPGANLCYLAKRFNYKPVAIEFSDYTKNIKTLLDFNGINNYEIINDDFFNITDNQFDVVTSYGFIEHFENYHNVINKHFDMLKPGGYLVISVQRFDGFQGSLFELVFEPKAFTDMMAAHNHKITDINELKHTVSQFTDTIIYCDYANDGILYYDWNHPDLKNDKRWLIYFINKISQMAGKSLPVDQFFSPHILLIARKPAHPFIPSCSAISKALEHASQQLSTKDYYGAISTLETCISKFPEWIETYRVLAEIQFAIDRKADAEQTLLKALEGSPQRRDIYEDLRRIYSVSDNKDKLNTLKRHMSLWHQKDVT